MDSKALRAAKARALDRVRATPPSPVGWTWRMVVVFVLALVTHLLGLATVAVGVALALDGQWWEAAIVVVVAAVLCPWRPHRMRGAAATSDKGPLMAWAKGVAVAAGTAPPDRVVMRPDVFAATWRGPIGRRWLGLGMEFFVALTPLERDAALLHELGHWAGRGMVRRHFVHLAIAAWERPLRWAHLVRPDAADEWWLSGPASSIEMGNLALFRILLTPVLVVHQVMIALFAEERVMAEYVADREAALVVGTDAIANTLLCLALWRDARNRAVASLPSGARTVDWTVVRSAVESVTVPDAERRLNELRVEQLRKGGVHPPHLDRIVALRAWPEVRDYSPDLKVHAAIDSLLADGVAAWSTAVANRW